MRNFLPYTVSLFLMALFITLRVFPVQSISPLQEKTGDISPRKVDDFEFLDTDSEGARLDAFSLELSKEPQSRAYIISYNQRDVPPGRFLRRVYGDKNYLVNYRGIEPSRIVFIN